jgi:MSHA pilin protein MshD
MSGKWRQQGFSLIEVVVAIVILAVGLVALLGPITNALRRSGDPLVAKQMTAVAEAMLEEIELKPFSPPNGSTCNPCAPTQANRINFDSVIAYNNYTNAGVCEIDDSACPAPILPYQVSVAVAQSALSTIPANQAYEISVTVNVIGPPGSPSVTVSGYRTNYF